MKKHQKQNCQKEGRNPKTEHLGHKNPDTERATSSRPNIQKSEEKIPKQCNATRDESSNPQAATNVGTRILDTTEELASPSNKQNLLLPFLAPSLPPSLAPFPLQRDPVTASLVTVTQVGKKRV